MQKFLGLLALLFVALVSLASFSQLFNPVGTLSGPRSFESVFNPGSPGTPWPFLNQINAVNYDKGGQGVAFSHTYNSGNCTAGTTYRPDFTNFNTINDSGATLDIGCFSAVGDFLNYIVNVTTAGPFVLNLRAGDGAAGASWSVLVDNAQTNPATTVQLANTGGYQTFQTFTSGQFNMTQGNHIIKLRCAVLDTGGACGDLVYLQGSLPQASTQVAAAVTLTNGPPNIPNASPCTTASCAWIGAGWPSGTHVSLVYADLTPISADYGGTFLLSDQAGHAGDASHFSISTSSVSYTDSFNNSKGRNVGEIKTSGTVSAGDYFITVTAAGASGTNSQNVTVHAASGTNVACGAAMPTSGTVLLSTNCAYANSSTISVSSNTTYIGAGNGGTIIDGQGTNCFAFNPVDLGGTGLAIIGIQFQNYTGACRRNSENQAAAAVMQLSDNNVVRNSRFVNNIGGGIGAYGGGTLIANNFINHMGYSGQGVGTFPSPSSGSDITVIGNELGDTNYLHNEVCDDAGVTKIVSQSGTQININLINNYYHDNASNGPWTDFFNARIHLTGNTHVRDGDDGNQWEQTRNGIEGDHNVYVHEGDGSSPTALASQCGGEGQQNPAVLIYGSANVNVHDNNISVYTNFDPILGANKTGSALLFDDEIGNGTGVVNNNTAHDNTVNFFTTNNFAVWGWNTSSEDTTGSSSNNNHFHLVGGNTSTDAHWYWFNQGNTAQTFANYRASGQDAGSTVDTADTSTTGCLHVACSGAGVGAGGVPLTAGAPAVTIQSIALSNSTFAPNVANGVVGTVSVTMSNGSAFAGSLSITGSNSGGFHLAGSTLQESGGTGTPAGTYGAGGPSNTAFNIVATQSTASNSPQQISPTLTGVVEGPFGGTARSMTSRIQAEDFDTGGSGVAYHATDACGIGIDTAYGSDRLNVYPTTGDLDGASNLKLGCTQAGDWHNYTITAATTGSYTLNLRVANPAAGATYHVAIDGATVASGIAVPNTGGYDTFATVTSPSFSLNAGQHIMQIALDAAASSGFGGDFNWMQGTLSGGASNVAAITLTNGPPNIPNASPCTPTSCAWIGAGWPSGTHVSLVFADMTPISTNYTGTFSLSGTNAGSFSISTSSVPYTDSFNNAKSRSVGEIKTNGVLSAADYSINVCAGTTCQPVTVHAASGTNVACGAGIPTSGTVILAPNCTYNNVFVNASNGSTFIGAGNGSTIFDGGGGSNGVNGGPTNVSVIGIQFQNYSGSRGTSILATADNGVVRNSRVINAGGSGINGITVVGGGSFIANNVVDHMTYSGMGVNMLPSPSSQATETLIGNEVAFSNFNNSNDPCDDVSATKIVSQRADLSTATHVINNYYHDNHTASVWPDTLNLPVVISGNTFVREGDAAAYAEQQNGGAPVTISNNAFIHIGDGSTPTSLSPGCGGEGASWGAVTIFGSSNVAAHDNNMSVFTTFDPILGGNKSGWALTVDDELGNGSSCPGNPPNVSNDVVQNNTVNWFTRDSGSYWAWWPHASCTNSAGQASDRNHFHLIGGNTSNDAHWFWSTQNATPQTFSNYKTSGQDTNSSIDTTDTSTPGCTHVACSGSGVGAQGVPQ